MNYINIIVSIVSGLAVCIPLVIKLVQYVQTAAQEKNWSKLLDLVMQFMATAEEKFDDGATRKEWVMALTKSAAKSINYEIDEAKLSELIDSLCTMSKVVNSDRTKV